MRDIKFRAWVKTDIEDDGIFEYMESDASTFLDPFELHKRGKIILLQYTGLNDKNGVEIYEGDVLKSDDKYNEIVSVVWNHGEFKLRLEFKRADVKGQEHTHHANIKIYPHRYTVIGNIYEDARLLDQ